MNKSVIFQVFGTFYFWKLLTPSGRKHRLSTWPSTSPWSATAPLYYRPSVPPHNSKEQLPNHWASHWAKPQWPAALWTTCAQVPNHLGSTFEPFAMQSRWVCSPGKALGLFFFQFLITFWKAQTPPRTFRDLISQGSNFFAFSPKWAWTGLRKTSLNP